MKRWFIIERCDTCSGWEQVPGTFSYEAEKKAETEMEKQNSRYAMRVRRTSKSHKPNPAPTE